MKITNKNIKIIKKGNEIYDYVADLIKKYGSKLIFKNNYFLITIKEKIGDDFFIMSKKIFHNYNNSFGYAVSHATNKSDVKIFIEAVEFHQYR